MPKFETIPDLIASYKDRFIPENAEGVDTVIQVILDQDPNSSFYLEIKDKLCHISEGTHDDPVLTAHSTKEDWFKLNNGEANPMMLMMQGKLKVDGPLHMATKFQAMFRE